TSSPAAACGLGAMGSVAFPGCPGARESGGQDREWGEEQGCYLRFFLARSSRGAAADEDPQEPMVERGKKDPQESTAKGEKDPQEPMVARGKKAHQEPMVERGEKDPQGPTAKGEKNPQESMVERGKKDHREPAAMALSSAVVSSSLTLLWSGAGGERGIVPRLQRGDRRRRRGKGKQQELALKKGAPGLDHNPKPKPNPGVWKGVRGKATVVSRSVKGRGAGASRR
ncbi:unnamed protein product, partial [Discosporangium mesarthrocarpum]